MMTLKMRKKAKTKPAAAQSIERVMPEERKDKANSVINGSRREEGRTLEGFALGATRNVARAFLVLLFGDPNGK